MHRSAKNSSVRDSLTLSGHRVWLSGVGELDRRIGQQYHLG